MQATDRIIIEQIKAALGTEEDGAALVDVARNAHRAEQKLAAIERKSWDRLKKLYEIKE